MAAGRRKFKPTRLLAIFTALLSLAVAILWADSYRDRFPIPLSHPEKDYPKWLVRHVYGYPPPPALIGMDVSHSFGDPSNIRLHTCEGRVTIHCISSVFAGKTFAPIVWSWGDFAYKRHDWRYLAGATPLPGSGPPLLYDGFEVSSPIWALFILCAAYPTIYFIRGPLRRRKRRRRGQCLECGYDLRGSGGQCPECGAATMDGPDVERNDGPAV
jgi:hypothetical protein